jgi:hypothetical protein
LAAPRISARLGKPREQQRGGGQTGGEPRHFTR